MTANQYKMKKNPQQEIAELKKELAHLSLKIEKLEKEYCNITKEEPLKIKEYIPVKEEKVALAPATNLTPLNNKNTKFTKQKEPKNNMNLETIYVKNIMTVLASILIFIGLASFVALIYNDLTETMKFALMCIFSFSLFGFGLWRVSKNKNVFSLSLASCGIGTVFISLLLSHFYFEIITSQILLFVLMIIWSIIILKLSQKFKSDMFIIISYIGFVFSLILGMNSSYAENLIFAGLLFIFQAIFSQAILNKRIEKGKQMYTVFPIISLIGTFIITFLAGSNLDQAFSKFSTLSEIFYVISILILICNNLSYINIIKNKLDFSNTLKVIIIPIMLFVFSANTILVATFGTNIKQLGYVNRPPILYSMINETSYNHEFYDGDYENELYYEYFDKEYEEYEYDDEYQYYTSTDDYFGILFVMLNVIQLLYIEFINLKNKYPTARNFIFYLFTISVSMAMLEDSMFEVLNQVIGFFIPAVIMMIYAHKTKDRTVATNGLLLFMMNIFISLDYHSTKYIFLNTGWFFLYSLLQIILFICITNFVRNDTHQKSKTCFYFISLFFITTLLSTISTYIGYNIYDKYLIVGNKLIFNEVDYESIRYLFGNDLSSIIPYFTISIYAFFAKHSNYYNFMNVNNNDFEYNYKSNIVYKLNNLLTVILMLVGVSLMHEIDYSLILRLIIMLIASIQCFINSKDLLESNNKFIGYYVGIKSTLFINLVLGVFIGNNDLGYLYSIMCLIISVISIVLGFNINLKSFRKYGLLLSLFSILKLILVDISYTSSIAQILSFICSGLICFFIVWIYTKLEEKNINID